MRLLRIIVNWSITLTAPAWAGFILPVAIVGEIIKDTGNTRKVMAGKDWVWRIK